MNFIKRYSSFPKSVQDFLKESDVNNFDDYIKEIDPNCKYTHDGFTILMMICVYSEYRKEDYHSMHIPFAFEKIKWLLAAGANPNIQETAGGWSALMMAACHSSPERGESSERTVEILLAARANLNTQNEDGYTALMIAACNSSPERGTSSENTVEILLTAGADPNKRDNRGRTALMIAAGNSHPEYGTSSEKTVEILLAAGADPNLLSNSGKSAKDLAKSENVKQMIEKHIFAKKWKIPQLINNGKTIKDIVCHICDDNNKDVVLKCGHTFCFECFKKFSESQKCPNCREAFTENDVKQFIL